MPAPKEDLIDLAYNAVVDASLWKHVTRSLVELAGGADGAMTRLDIGRGTGTIDSLNDDSAVRDRYFAHFYRINPLQIVQDPAAYVHGWTPKILLDEDWMPRDAFERTEYYNDFLRPLGANWGMMIRLGLEGSNVSVINVARPFGRGRFEAPDIARVAQLQPHLVRANALSEKFAALHGLSASLTAALDRSPAATLLLDGDGRIVHANAAAGRRLARNDLIAVRHGRLSAVDTRKDKAFAAMIGRAATDDSHLRRAGSLSLHAAGSPLPMVVSASPLRMETAAALAHGAAVLVCMADPTGGAPPPETGLIELFGLTAAESRLGAALCQGLDLREISTRNGISINTARVQLTSIFAKLGVRRQIDAIRLMMAHGAFECGEPHLAEPHV